MSVYSLGNIDLGGGLVTIALVSSGEVAWDSAGNAAGGIGGRCCWAPFSSSNLFVSSFELLAGSFSSVPSISLLILCLMSLSFSPHAGVDELVAAASFALVLISASASPQFDVSIISYAAATCEGGVGGLPYRNSTGGSW